MNHKNFMSVAGMLFGIIALAHLLRLVLGWPVVLGSFVVPVWFSAIPAVLAGYLAAQAFRLKNKGS